METKTFLLGCGAQKSGTTWVARNLNNSSEYWNGGIKEWRFWKYYFNRDSIQPQIQKIKKDLQDFSHPKYSIRLPKLKWRISVLQDPDSFLQNICDNFISRKNIKVLGDMSPINGISSIDELTIIKEYFNERGIIVKPLLIMRDPLERIWSDVRMKIIRYYSEQHQKNEHFITDRLLERYCQESVEKKTRYEQIIKNIESIFDKQNICYEFSENLFSKQGFDRITKHLGISIVSANINSVNSSPKLIDIPKHVKLEIINYYKETYFSIADKFGDDVKTYWNDSFRLLSTDL